MNADIRIVVDTESNAQPFWDAVRAADEAHTLPDAIVSLLARGYTSEVTVSRSDARLALRWCETQPGWDDGPTYAPTALLFLDADGKAFEP